MRRKNFSILLLMVFTGMSCWPGKGTVVSKTVEMMGTLVGIHIYTNDVETSERVMQEAFQEMRRIENLFSLWIPESEVSQLNQFAWQKHVWVSPEVLGLIKTSLKISEETEGAFDITVMPLSKLWKENIKAGKIPSHEEIKKIKKNIGFNRIRIDNEGKVTFLKKGVKLDFGAIAKGYAVDRAASVLKKGGFNDFIVEAWGDLYVSGLKGTRKWQIGIRHPRLEGELLDKMKIENQAVSTSGDYEQYLDQEKRRYHHIIDPKTGFPAYPCISVTVFAKTCTLADAYATSIFVLGPQKAESFVMKHPGISVIMVYQQEGQLKKITFTKEAINHYTFIRLE